MMKRILTLAWLFVGLSATTLAQTADDDCFYIGYGDLVLTATGNGNELQLQARNNFTAATDGLTQETIRKRRLWQWNEGGTRLCNMDGHFLQWNNDEKKFYDTDNFWGSSDVLPTYDTDGQAKLCLRGWYAKSGGGGDWYDKEPIGVADGGTTLGIKNGGSQLMAIMDYTPRPDYVYNIRTSLTAYWKCDGTALTTNNPGYDESGNQMCFTLETVTGGYVIRSYDGHYVGWDSSAFTLAADKGSAAIFTFGHDANEELLLQWGGSNTLAVQLVRCNRKQPLYYGDGVHYYFQFLLGQDYDLYDQSESTCTHDMLAISGQHLISWEAEQEGEYFLLKNSRDHYVAYSATTHHYYGEPDKASAARFSLVCDADGQHLIEKDVLDTEKAFAPDGTTFRRRNPADFEARMRLIATTQTTIPTYHTETSALSVLHRQSYFADRAATLASSGTTFPDEFLQSGEGMKTKTLSGGGTVSIQNTPEYEVTRYVKRGEFTPLYIINTKDSWGSAHIAFQRWYQYDTELPLSIDYFLPENEVWKYANGTVMGERLKTSRADFKTQNPVTHVLMARLPSGHVGDELTIAGDISRYADLSYANMDATTAATAGNLREPTLSMRHIYHLKDAKLMATALMAKTGGNWLEEHTIHFPNITIGATPDYVPLNHSLENYWIFTGGGTDDHNLLKLVNDENLEITLENEGGATCVLTGLLDAPTAYNNNGQAIANTDKARRRMIGFKYSAQQGQDGYTVADLTVPAGSKTIIKVRAKDGDSRYNLARFTIVFDGGSETLYYEDVLGDEAPRRSRSPRQLREYCDGHDPVAHIDFDYPHGASYQWPTNQDIDIPWYDDSGTRAMNAGLPLKFDHTNFAFTYQTTFGSPWGMYAVSNDGSFIGRLRPVSQYTHDRLSASQSYGEGYLYIDASEVPGIVATIPFSGSFCTGSRLMCSGWICSVNGLDDSSVGMGNKALAGIILDIIGIDAGGNETTLYRFCPGQVDNRYRRYGETAFCRRKLIDGQTDYSDEKNGEGIWHQFYFNFVADHAYTRYELRIENNSTNTNGADYLLDDIWVFAKQPTVRMAMASPLCGGDLQVIKLETDFEPLLVASGETELTGDDSKEKYLSFVYLDRDKFYAKFMEEIKKAPINWTGTSADFATQFEAGAFNSSTYETACKTAFKHAVMRKADNSVACGSFAWNTNFAKNTPYNFTAMAADAANTVYATTDDGVRKLVCKGTMNVVGWENYKNYLLLTVQYQFTGTPSDDDYAAQFDPRDACSNKSHFKMKPKLGLIGYSGSQSLDEIAFCQGTTRTFALRMEGYRVNDATEDIESYHLNDVHFDWWVGNSTTAGTEANFNLQQSAGGIELKTALGAFRQQYPNATDITDPAIVPVGTLTADMLAYLRSLATGVHPQLLLNSKLIDVTLSNDRMKIVEETNLDGGTEHFVYFCAIPIAQQVGTIAAGYYVCTAPQSLKVKVSGMAPVVHEGFAGRSYPAELPTLKVRMTMSQLSEVMQGDGRTMHIPLRLLTPTDASVTTVGRPAETASQVVMLTGSNDVTAQEYVLSRYRNFLPPPIGQLTSLKATKDKSEHSADEVAKLCFNSDFTVHEGYTYNLRFLFAEQGIDNTCEGTRDIVLAIVPEYQVWTGNAHNNDWNNDRNWSRADGPQLYSPGGYTQNADNYVTPDDRTRKSSFTPLPSVKVVLPPNAAPSLYDAPTAGAFPDLNALTATEWLKYDFTLTPCTLANADQAVGDLIATDYAPNTCEKIVFQPGAQLLNAHRLSYQKAWVEYELAKDLWHLLGSPLQDMVAGEWYAPTGNARQETPYFEPVTFGSGYNRFAPAIYQRSWDKATTILYEVGASVYDANGTAAPTPDNGYIEHLGYRYIADKTANVAVRGDWSHTYNDVATDYSAGAFSVKVTDGWTSTALTGNALIRLPKEDTSYSYYSYGDDPATVLSGSAAEAHTTTTVSTANRGRLKSDHLKSATSFTETVTADGGSALGYFLVGNPFPCGLDMTQFFDANTGLTGKYWTLSDGQQHPHLVDSEAEEATTVAPGQGFFVKTSTTGSNSLTVTFNTDMMTKHTISAPVRPMHFTITATDSQDNSTSAEVRLVPAATTTYNPQEDVELFYTNYQTEAPLVYTLAGPVATAINQLPELGCVPIGIMSQRTDSVVLRFSGTEAMNEKIFFVDALTGRQQSLSEGTIIIVTPADAGRYFLTTAIKDMPAMPDGDGTNTSLPLPVYNLQGQRVGTTDHLESLPRGILISGGRKFVRR